MTGPTYALNSAVAERSYSPMTGATAAEVET